jgi:hypothetical protein
MSGYMMYLPIEEDFLLERWVHTVFSGQGALQIWLYQIPTSGITSDEKSDFTLDKTGIVSIMSDIISTYNYIISIITDIASAQNI